MTIIGQTIAYLAVIIFVILVVYAVALARMWRDLTRLADQKPQPPPQQPATDELGKVRENIEGLLDVLEERSAVAERQLRQLIEEAKDAAKQIDEATAAAVKVLERAATSPAPAAPVEAFAPDLEQSAPREPANYEPIPQREAAANGQPAAYDSHAADDPLLEPLVVERAAAGFATETPAQEPPAAKRAVSVGSGDPLSAWAPYQPANRGEERPNGLAPAEAAPDDHAEAIEAVVTEDHEVTADDVETSGHEEAGGLAEADAEEPAFRPFSIKPAEEPANPEEEFAEAAHQDEPVISAIPIQAHIYASEMDQENEEAHGNGVADEALLSGAHAEDGATAHGVDPYSAVYTLAELGVTDVSEIARRTGLGQTEVEMVLNLWRRQ